MRAAVLLAALAACSARPAAPPPPPPPLPAAAYTHYLRGRLAGIEGDAELSARELARAVAAAPDEPEIRVAYIEALLAAGRRRDARAVAERARLRWPERADIQLAAGRVHRKLGGYRRAAAALERARRLDPDSEDAATELADTYVAMEQPEAAAAVYRELLERRPEAIEPRLELARILAATRRFAAAEPVIAGLLELEPGNIEARVLHAGILERLDREGEAVASLREAFARSGRDLRVAARLFRGLLEQGDRAAALRVLDELIPDQLDGDDRVQLGRLYLQVGRFRRALVLASSAAEAGAGEDATRLRARALAELRRFADAAAAARAAPAQPGGWALGFAAEMLARAGRSAEALELLESAEPHPHRDIARARVLEIGGDIAAARAALRAARRRWPESADVAYWAASLELRAGRHRAALRLAEPLLASQPESWQLQNFVGYVLADAGIDLDRAAGLLGRALEQRPAEPGILDSMGWLHHRRGETGAAARHLYRALRLAPTDPEILYHVGALERRLGRLPAARRRLRLALGRALEPGLRRRIEAELAAL